MQTSVIHWVELGDHRLMRQVNRWRPPRWLRLWMIAATRCGDGWLWYGIGGSGCAVRRARNDSRPFWRRRPRLGIGIALFLKLKRAFGRKRPCALEPHCWATLLPPDQFSFPSGHTITAFAVAISLGAFYPHMRAELLFCAASVACSRILLGMHFLSDVVAGGIAGRGIGLRVGLSCGGWRNSPVRIAFVAHAPRRAASTLVSSLAFLTPGTSIETSLDAARTSAYAT